MTATGSADSRRDTGIIDPAAGAGSPTSVTPGGSVRILPADVQLTVWRGETIVDAIRRHGYRTRYRCRRGGCGVCKADLIAGDVSYRVPVAGSVLSQAELDQGKCLPCRAEPLGEIVIRLSARDRLRRIIGSKPAASGTTGQDK